jgi:hypothetical protein
MADIYLHSKLSEQVIKDLSRPLNQDIVFVGAQGPDPMYYNVSKKDGLESRYYADRMHDTNTRLLFKNMVPYVKSHLTEETYSFLIGFICHYALDVSVHPYVYYNVGVYKKDDPATHQYRGLHLKFERSMDAVMIQKDFTIPSRKFRLTRKYFPKTVLSPDVCKMMEHTLKNTYGKDNGGKLYCVGVKKMQKNVRNLITDQFGIKKLLLKFVDLFGSGDMFLQDLSFFNHVEKGIDFLNEEKNTWYHPITNTPSNDSVEEMFEKAKVFAHSLITQVDAYLYDIKEVDLESVFTNLSFNSGLDCDLHDEMKYFRNYKK